MSDVNALLRALGASAPEPLYSPLSGLLRKVPPSGSNPFGSLAPPPPFTSLADLLNPVPPTPRANALASIIAPLPAPPQATNALVQKPETKRKAYFAFDFDDLFRVNNVRKAWSIRHPDSSGNRSFYDRSIWESRKIRDDDTLKNLMRNAIRYSSAVCVLVGSDTWRSRWVRYEIARSVAEERGLLAVHINGLNHVQRRAPDPNGLSPLKLLGIYHAENGRYYLCEKKVEIVDVVTEQLDWNWRVYDDYTDPVPLPRYVPSIQQGYVVPLSAFTRDYDYVAEIGHMNIGAWIDTAAVSVGR